jgi:5-methylcytosine-specific restriction endonuclease McrA
MGKKKRTTKKELTPEQKRKKFITYRDNFAKGKLRQASMRWAPRGEALRAARRERGKYECSYCHGLYPSQKIHMDHREPIVPLEGMPTLPEGGIDWNVWISRCFIPMEDWNVLCESCHSAKTSLEDAQRAFYRDKKKEERDEKYKNNGKD